VRSAEDVERVLDLARAGRNQSEIARLTGISRTTVRDWLAGRLPVRCESAVTLVDGLPRRDYAYLLGLYLGDGFLAHGPRAACLRIFFDARYPGIIGSAGDARGTAAEPSLGGAPRADAVRRRTGVVDALA
jgi:hypothetical protein